MLVELIDGPMTCEVCGDSLVGRSQPPVSGKWQSIGRSVQVLRQHTSGQGSSKKTVIDKCVCVACSTEDVSDVRMAPGSWRIAI